MQDNNYIQTYKYHKSYPDFPCTAMSLHDFTVHSDALGLQLKPRPSVWRFPLRSPLFQIH